MPFLAIDTETNGKPDYKRSADKEGQPRVAEFAGIIVNDRGDVIAERQFYVEPPIINIETGEREWTMTPETTEINKITDDMLFTQGVPISMVLDWYETQILSGLPVVAFGAQFDCKMMRGEFRRAGRDDLFERTRNICLMRSARPFAASLGRTIVKAGGNQKGWPKLTDLATFCGVPFDPNELHGALADVRLKAACFKYMLANGFDPKPEVHRAKDYDTIKNAE